MWRERKEEGEEEGREGGIRRVREGWGERRASTENLVDTRTK